MVTSRDVARLAGVSQATVSRVLHGSTKVAGETRARVESVLQSTGYRPHAAATAMRTRRTGTIGVVVARITNPFYPQLLEALGTELEQRGLRMILWDSATGPGERAAIDAIEQRLVDGLLFTTATGESSALRSAIRRRSPVVLVNRVVSGSGACDRVDSENHPTSVAMARYFAAGGHTRVGLVGAPQVASTARDRMAGFVQGVEREGLRLSKHHIVDGGFTHEGGATALQRIMRDDGDAPTALFCVNDLSALGALDAARALGIRVPEDLWVTGYDDIDMASWEAYQLTTARQPTRGMARAAVDLLIDRVENPTRQAVHRCFPSEIVVRRSTGFVATPSDTGPSDTGR